MESTMVAGEPIDVLVKALASFEWKKTRAGMVRFTSQMDADVGQSFLRALMRVEAELLAKDADRIGRSTIGAEAGAAGCGRPGRARASLADAADAGTNA